MANFKAVIPRHDDQKFNTFAAPSLKKLGTQVLQIKNSNEDVNESIFAKYNAGIEALLQTGLQDDDIVIFMHEDVGLIDEIFREKIEFLFSETNDVAIFGVAGSIEITEKGGWWMTTPDKMRGHLIQGKNDANQGEGFHLQKGAIGYWDDVVCVDGCIMVTKGQFIKEGLAFDDKTFEFNDFYDIDFCFRAMEMGYKIAVADFLIFHQSTGMGVFDEKWKKSKEKLFEKWTAKGYKLPFTRDQFKLKDIDSQIVEIDI